MKMNADNVREKPNPRVVSRFKTAGRGLAWQVIQPMKGQLGFMNIRAISF